MHAGTALAERGLFLAHAMAQALGGRYGVSHGAMNALCLAPALRFNEPVGARGDRGARRPRSAHRTRAERRRGARAARRLRASPRLRHPGGRAAPTSLRKRRERPGARSNPRPATPTTSRRSSARSGEPLTDPRSRADDVDMAVEYAGILAAVTLLAATLTGAYGQNVAPSSRRAAWAIAAVAQGATAQKVSSAGAKAAYKRAPYEKPALKYLYALGWIGGTKNPGQCGLTLLGREARPEIRLRARSARTRSSRAAQERAATSAPQRAAKASSPAVVSACA